MSKRKKKITTHIVYFLLFAFPSPVTDSFALTNQFASCLAPIKHVLHNQDRNQTRNDHWEDAMKDEEQM